jgi:putative MATE family efflux protein
MTKSYQINMTEGSIVKKLLQFSVPLIFSSLLQILFNTADVIVVGRFAGDNSLGAVGSTGSLINLMVNLFVGLSVGTTVVAANFFGAGKKSELKETVHTAILLSLISGIILTIFGVVGAKKILQWMQSPKEILDLATQYLQIYFGGIISTMIYNFGSALLRAKGDTKRPLYILFFAGIINVILNLIFVILFKMDVAGVALATVISQTISAFLVVRCLLKETEEFKLDLKQLKINPQILIRIIKIGVPAGLQGIIFSLSNVIIQSSINSFGAIVIAGNSAALNIENFIFTGMNGFSQGTLTFISQNFGAKKYNRINKTIIIALFCVFLVGFVFGNLTVIFGRKLLSFFTTSPEVIESGISRLKIICTTYALCGMMDVMGNAIRGIGHSVLPMIITLLGACGIRLLWISTIFLIPKFHSCNTIFVSYPISWTATFIAHIICFLIIRKKEFSK